MVVWRPRPVDRRGCELRQVRTGRFSNKRAEPRTQPIAFSLPSHPFAKPTVPNNDTLAPGEKRGGRRGRRHGRKRVRQAVSIALLPRMIVAACAGALVFFAVTDGGANVRKYEPMLPKAVEVARFAGFGLEQVAVVGNKHTDDAAIFKALGLDTAQTFFSLDISVARKRIETLSWIKTAAITRIFPGQLSVKVTERTPIAVWKRGDGKRPALLDATGRVLGSVPKDQNVAGLVRLKGAGASDASTNLMTVLSHYKPLSEHLHEAERVGERRWTLHLRNGALVHLPADGVDATLRRAKVQKLLASLAQYANTVIDLRTPGRISIRRRTAKVAEAG